MSLVPWQGVWAQGSLCSLDDAGLPLSAGSQACYSWLPAMPQKAEIPARVRYWVAGKWPQSPRQSKQTARGLPGHQGDGHVPWGAVGAM